jgi:hypothetical protein
VAGFGVVAFDVSRDGRQKAYSATLDIGGAVLNAIVADGAVVAAEAASLLLSRFDGVDLEGDGQADATVARVGLPGEPQVAFAGGQLYVGAELDYGATTVEALLEVELPVCVGGGGSEPGAGAGT